MNCTGGAPTVLAVAVVAAADMTSAAAMTMANDTFMGSLLIRVARKA
jgi:hypothetical protein